MEPLKPEEIDRILRERPDVSRHEIEEYERLLAERFQHDPDVDGDDEYDIEYRIHRIHDLYHKIFGLEEDK